MNIERVWNWLRERYPWKFRSVRFIRRPLKSLNGYVTGDGKTLVLTTEHERAARAILHEAAHILAPPFRQGTQWKIHHYGFWLTENKLIREAVADGVITPDEAADILEHERLNMPRSRPYLFTPDHYRRPAAAQKNDEARVSVKGVLAAIKMLGPGSFTTDHLYRAMDAKDKRTQHKIRGVLHQLKRRGVVIARGRGIYILKSEAEEEKLPPRAVVESIAVRKVKALPHGKARVTGTIRLPTGTRYGTFEVDLAEQTLTDGDETLNILPDAISAITRFYLNETLNALRRNNEVA